MSSNAQVELSKEISEPSPIARNGKSVSSVYMKDKEGITLSFQDIHFSVELKNGEFKEILKGVSAYCQPGQLLAVMGPSGSGKTTLLNVLSDRASKTSDRKMLLDGKMLFGGKPLTSETKKKCGYVSQDDHHINNLTVREILQNSAFLRLPEEMSKEEKLKKVDKVIEDLGLEKVTETVVGGSMVRGISGGERKRLSVGVEMITDPWVLFMDEPTSGLDSHMAFSLFEKVDHLKELNRTIVATIHQPSSKLVEKFDYILLLSEGKTVYFGPTKEAVQYFLEKCSLRCPLYSNPAEFFLDVCSLNHEPDLDVGYEGEGKFEWQTAIDTYYSTLHAEVNAEIDLVTKKIQSKRSSQFSDLALENKDLEALEAEHDAQELHETKVAFSTGFLTQFQVLAKRSFLALIRDKRYFRARLMQVVIMSILIGIIFYKLPNSQSGLRSRTGAIFFLTMQFGIGPMMSVLHTFAHERVVIEHERGGKWYGALPYFFGKSSTEIPLQVVEPILYACITYYMVGLNPVASRFFTFVGLGIITSLCGSSFGLMLGAATPSYEIATIFAGLLLLLLILFSGFFVDTSLIPVWLRWLKYVSYIHYTFNIGLKNELEGESFYCTASELSSSNQKCPITTGVQAMKAYGIDPNLDIAFNFGIMVIFLVGLRVLTYLFLRFYRPKS